MSDDGRRYYEIDGIRGWAALSVVCYHIFWETFGILLPGLRNPVSHVLLNGELDVAVFFVLSGDALSTRYWQNRSRADAVALVLKRYTRLTIPIFFSCLIVLALMDCGLVFTHEVTDVIKRPDWMGLFLNASYSLRTIIHYSLIDVYLHNDVTTSPNPFLWTMSIEMLGSIIVFLFILSAEHIKKLNLTLLIIAALFLLGHSFIACFPIGVLYARLRAEGYFERGKKTKWLQLVSLAVVLFSMIIVGYRSELNLGAGDIPTIFGACGVVGGIYLSSGSLVLFRSRLSRWLGKISLPLYLVQFPVIASFTSGTIIWAFNHTKFQEGIQLGIACSSLALCLVGALVFEPVEMLTRRVGKFICRKFLK